MCLICIIYVWIYAYIWKYSHLFDIHFSFPRYLNEVLCDYQDSSCLSGEGAGYQRIIRITFKRDTDGKLGVGKLGDWEDYVQEIRTSCSCQLLPNSLFRPFI